MKNVGQDVMIDVAGKTINLRGVDHHGVGTGFHSSSKSRQEVFPQVVFRNPGGSTGATGERKTVAHVMFQAGSNMVLRADVCTFQATHEGYAHYFRKIRIFTECFVEAWPN